MPWSTLPMYANPLLSTAMPCPCGGSKEPMTLPSLSKWIIDGGRLQQSAIGGFNSASSSISVRSLGRSSAQTLSSLSTARPVIPPIFHWFGSGLGQSGSNLNFGAVSVGAPRSARKTPAPKNATQTTDSENSANLAQALVIQRIFTVPSSHVTMLDARNFGTFSAESIPRNSACQQTPKIGAARLQDFIPRSTCAQRLRSYLCLFFL